MRHVPFPQLKFIKDGMPRQELSYQFLCTVCPRARQSRLPFPNSEIKITRCFELLHVDTWGPFKTSTHDGCKLFLTIVDDFSRLTWIYMMYNKSDVVQILSNFVESIKTQFFAIVQKIRKDNAQELYNGPIQVVYQSKGILHQNSCTDTPQHNGVVEQKYKHLMETTRAFYIQSKVHVLYWGECVKNVVYLINRMSSKKLNNASQYEILFHHKPYYSLLGVFGCLCFVSTLKHDHSKLDPRAGACVFIGYHISHKWYTVLNLLTNKISVSRDVQFFEEHFISCLRHISYKTSTHFSTCSY